MHADPFLLIPFLNTGSISNIHRSGRERQRTWNPKAIRLRANRRSDTRLSLSVRPCYTREINLNDAEMTAVTSYCKLLTTLLLLSSPGKSEIFTTPDFLFRTPRCALTGRQTSAEEAAAHFVALRFSSVLSQVGISVFSWGNTFVITQ